VGLSILFNAFSMLDKKPLFQPHRESGEKFCTKDAVKSPRTILPILAKSLSEK
jgi:hypothetical protein